ncbi:GGDEF domain-containing protein [Domibacillus sp. DTU_2020_1001157_1_SI_ALB_TIR_016]|uniref:GGDEF domain-containing protein n=1 Tax=Domibacillus sp. DTU_2020_1001157_1_SI_ALB_TIR_016 TaxID=3077789 RepID=UPI0039773CFC
MFNTNENESKKTAERIQHTIEQAGWNSYGVTISIGVTLFMHNDTDMSVIDRAARALYLSKNQGRNRVTLL